MSYLSLNRIQREAANATSSSSAHWLNTIQRVAALHEDTARIVSQALDQDPKAQRDFENNKDSYLVYRRHDPDFSRCAAIAILNNDSFDYSSHPIADLPDRHSVARFLIDFMTGYLKAPPIDPNILGELKAVCLNAKEANKGRMSQFQEARADAGKIIRGLIPEAPLYAAYHLLGGSTPQDYCLHGDFNHVSLRDVFRQVSRHLDGRGSLEELVGGLLVPSASGRAPSSSRRNNRSRAPAPAYV